MSKPARDVCPVCDTNLIVLRHQLKILVSAIARASTACVVIDNEVSASGEDTHAASPRRKGKGKGR